MSKRTKQACLIGWPISHSLSPAMHNAAFAELGLDWHYSLFPTKPEELEAFFMNLGANNIAGANVTMPHKQMIVPYLDQVSDDARVIGAVNTIHVKSGSIIGYNTDAIGFLKALKETGFEPKGMRVAMLGAGGAARAAVFALAQSGAERIVIVNRTVERGVHLSRDMSRAFPTCHVEFRPLVSETLIYVSTRVDLLVNATSVGMHPNDGVSIWPDDLPIPDNTICYDVIYSPVQTLFLQRAQAAGRKTINGLGMLIHQGATSFEIWTGQNAPMQAMKKACLETLGDDQ